MIYLIGGAPRTGKSILAQRIAAKRSIGWISTDLLVDLLRVKEVVGTKTGWDPAPESIAAAAEWFFPCLERFVWGISSLTDQYVIEGVDFLPAQIARLAIRFPVRPVFLGCANMTVERFARFPGRSPGYASLSEEVRRQFAQDIPRWSEFIQRETRRLGYPYIDMSDDFEARLREAEAVFTDEP